MRTPLADLEVLRSPDDPTAGGRRVRISVPDGVGGGVSLEIDVRGFRLTEALQEVERQVDGALLSGVSTFAVIHGLGDGILQKGVRDYLRGRHEVGTFDFAPANEGGFGKTIVTLR